MLDSICIVIECARPNKTRGMCNMHYQRARKSGEIKPLPKRQLECKECGAEFQSSAPHAKYCSRSCKDRGKPSALGHPCRVCGKPVATKSGQKSAGKKSVHRACLPLMPNGRRSEHGASGYRKGGCRCDVCIAGHAAEYRAWSRKRFEETGQWHRGRWIKEDERIALYERDNWTCQICFDPVLRTAWSNDPKDATLDHILPRSKGGSHDPENLRTACFLCNARRSDNTEDLVLL